jgi:uncharacterized delta-60 repeat protein
MKGNITCNSTFESLQYNWKYCVEENMKSMSDFFKKNRFVSFALALVVVLLVSTTALSADGNLDPTFGSNGIAITDLGTSSDAAYSLALQPDGKIVILGSAPGQQSTLMRFKSNGSVDGTFGVGGKLTVAFGGKVAIQPDGKLIVAGSSGGSFAVARYLSNGSGLDTNFGTNGVAKIPSDPGDFYYVFSDLAIQPDQKIVLVGTQESGGHTTNIFVARFNSDGTPDDTFVAHGFNFLDETNFPQSAYFRGQAVAIQTDGKIVLSANMYDSDTVEQIGIARLKPDGSLDTSTFGTNGKGTVAITVPNIYNVEGGLALQADGKILVAGTVFDYGSSTNDNLVVARFNTNGSLDSAFGGSGTVTTDFGKNENANGVVVQPDGKIVVVGKIFNGDPADILLVRYNSDGLLDNTFGVNGKVVTDLGNSSDAGRAIAIQTDGNLVVAGSSNGDALLARYARDLSDLPKTTVTFRSTSAYDGWIRESAENSNKGGALNRVATTVNVGDDRKDRQYRSILSFNTVSIPDNAVVTSAELRVRRQSIVGDNPFKTHGALFVDIKNSAFSRNLTLRLSDFRAAASGRDRIRGSGSVWYTVDLQTKNLAFINKYGVTQFRLRFAKDDDDDMRADYIKFFSGNAADPYRPKLIITYVLP